VGLWRIGLGTKGSWWEQEEFNWNYLRIWWRQKDFDGLLTGTRGIWLELFENLMRTKGFWWVIDRNKRNLIGTIWELDENKRILMGYWWEQKESDRSHLRTWWEQKDFDRLLKGTRGIWWELFENLMRTMDMNWTCPPLKKKRNIPWGHVDATQLALLACFILMFILGTSYWDRCCPSMKLSLTNCQGAGR
jgi:hypothetical protein